MARRGPGPPACQLCLRSRCLILALAVLAATGLLVSWRYQRYGDMGVLGDWLPGRPARTPGTGPLIHVLLCSDDTDLRPVTAAIRSAHASASEPGRLVFHVVTLPQLAPVLQELLPVHLSGARLEVHHNASIESHIESYTEAPGGNASTFGFVPFYLDAFLARPGASWDPPERVIYVDAETVVLGDLVELFELDLRGHPTAAVPHCRERLGDRVRLDALGRLGFTRFDPKACMVHSGLMVVDAPRWRALDVTGRVESWMRRRQDARPPLWKGPGSREPWTLALDGDYLPLGEEWNCAGLGREGMEEREVEPLKTSGLSRGALHRLAARRPQGGLDLLVEVCSKRGKLLRFDGEVKPWLVETLPADKPLPRCSLPDRLPSARWSLLQLVTLLCRGARFVACADIWSAYLSPDAACALKDFDKEWRAAEKAWEERRAAEEPPESARRRLA